VRLGRLPQRINVPLSLYETIASKMTLDDKEDQTAPVCLEEVINVAASDSTQDKQNLIVRLLKALGEKRDAYSGIINSIIYIIDCEKTDLINMLKDGIVEGITLNPMRPSGRMFLSKALSRLSTERPLFVIELFEHVIETVTVWSIEIKDPREILRIQIASIKAIQQALRNHSGRPTRVGPDIIDRCCFEAIFYGDEASKLDTLSLTIESRSTTKFVESKEMELFKVLVEDALSLQNPALRQVFISLTNKLIKRMKDSHKTLHKFAPDFQETVNARYMAFLVWLIEFCFGSIYCNAYFGSFTLTLSTLRIIIQQITFNYEGLPIESCFKSRRCFDSILSCINDSFEENKTLALNLLLALPHSAQFVGETNLKPLEEITDYLICSVNPAHSMTCQYLLKLIVGLKQRQTDSVSTVNQNIFQQLDKLLTIIEDNIEDAKEDFVVALKHKSIYPKLTCLRALLGDIDVECIKEDRGSWRRLVKRIVTSSIDACRVVSTIVCNLNPETIGHLPMDLKPVDAETLSKTLKVSLNLSGGELNVITSQMLLISGWKTIKECSLSLGVLCQKFWWPVKRIEMRKEKFRGFEIEPILESSDITTIIEFFDHYLRNLRHRGAFEQAYNGFIMVARRVWHDDYFRARLIEMLQTIMSDFKEGDASDSRKVECLKAYVTRRSAGLPFIVQAILNAEHKHDSKNLRWVMDSLFEVLENESSEEYKRLHCLNILRALIKEHCLGEKVLSYIGKTFSITLDSLGSNSFPVRNCANMLLKAIVDRTFGVNRLRNDIHRRNQLSFERFFTECPSLRSKMLKHLEEGSKETQYLASVHAVFIILHRLRPSLNPSDDYDTDKIVKPFIEPILKLSSNCPDFKLRIIASNLAIRLENFCHLQGTGLERKQVIYQELSRIMNKQSPNLDQNRLHGTFLVAKDWIRTNASTLDDDFFIFINRVLKEVCLSESDDFCNSTRIAALDLVEVCSKHQTGIDWLEDFYPMCRSLFDSDKWSQEPHFEGLVFRYFTVLLLGTSYMYKDEDFYSQSKLQDLNKLLDLLRKIITREPTTATSTNIQASLIRFMRQLLTYDDEYIDELIEKLDLDYTAAHVTPFDELNSKFETDYESKMQSRRVHDRLRKYLRSSSQFDDIFNFTIYKEFQPLQGRKSAFQARYSNTCRAAELMAFAYKNWEVFNLKSKAIWTRKDESQAEKLTFGLRFISGLPSCDIKHMVLLCVGKLMKEEIGSLATDDGSKSHEVAVIVENFGTILLDLTESDQSTTMREACLEVLRPNLEIIIQTRAASLKIVSLNLIKALMKLAQDEDHGVRSSSQRVMSDITRRSLGTPTGSIRFRSHLDRFIELISTLYFDPNVPQELNTCFQLLTTFMFSEASDFSESIDQDNNRLFDKTKLNSFADHVATINSSLKGLELFFQRRKGTSERVHLDCLTLPFTALTMQSCHENPSASIRGDYSWRIERIKNRIVTESKLSPPRMLNNSEMVDQLLENIHASLSYFSKSYWNMLVDTDYTQCELALFRKVTFFVFIIKNTEHSLKNMHLIPRVQDTLQAIVTNSCATTLLSKCTDLIRQINGPNSTKND